MKKKIITVLTVTAMMLSSTNAFAATRNYARSRYTNISLNSLCNNYLSGSNKNSCSQNSLSDFFKCYYNGNCEYIFTNGCQNNNNSCGNNGSCDDFTDCTGGSCEASDNTQKPSTDDSQTEKPDTTQKPSTDNNQSEKPDNTQKPSTDNNQTEKPDTTQKPNTDNNQTDTSESAYAAEVVRLVNAERAKEGLSALKSDSTVQAAAQVRAKETVTSFSHTRPNGSSCFTALQEAGVSYMGAGENIAYGQKTPAEVVNAWMNSPGHRANIMNGSFTTIGVGCYKSGNTYYWSQFFIS